ncbi:MAG: MMPL family transporter, partial [Nocardioides sp.]|nr:MMPL family transporter [Nocardioides sp.]
AVMLTLLPALLVVTGRWVFWPARPAYGSAEPTASGLWARLGGRIAKTPRRVWIGTAAVLLACCAGLMTLHVQTLSGADQYTKTFDSNVGDQLMQDHGLADLSSPIQVVSNKGTGDDVVAALHKAGFDDAQTVTAASSPVAVSTVPVTSDPLSQAAFDKVGKVRDVIHGVDGADAMATGTSAVQLDAGKATNRDAELIIPLVLCVVLVILMLLLRAVLAPLVLMATVVLSFGASLGLAGLLFAGLGFAGEGNEFPLYVFVFLVALGIDYNIFLMTRVREEAVETGDTRRAAVVALSATGGVITSAGVVLAATFAVLGTLPFVAFVEIGVAVALGVLLDTLVVRSVLVTALNLDLGDAIWWPSALARGRKRTPAAASPAERQHSGV